MSDIVIKASHLSKSFLRIEQKSHKSLLGINPFSLFWSKKSKEEEASAFWALKDISFTIKKGEVVSLIGNNGAGKSTLLKILAHVMQPTSGKVELQGQVRALLGVGTGFHPDLSGLENIFFNASILGMKRKEVKMKLDEIIFFSGLKNFLDTPIKYYSNGMKIRLGFAVAAHLEPEILLLDEVLMVGDEEFKKRSITKIKEIARNHGCCILFASHNMGAVREVCQKGILMEKGKIKQMGEINELIEDYKEKAYKKVEKIKLKETLKAESQGKNPQKSITPSFVIEDSGGADKFKYPLRKWESDRAPATDAVKLLQIAVAEQGKANDQPLKMGKPLNILIHFEKLKEEGVINPTIQLISGLGEAFMITSGALKAELPNAMPIGTYSASCQIPGNLLNSGRFYIDLFFHRGREKQAVFRMNRVLLFEITPPEEEFGVKYRKTIGPIRPLLDWEVKQESQ